MEAINRNLPRRVHPNSLFQQSYAFTVSEKPSRAFMRLIAEGQLPQLPDALTKRCLRARHPGSKFNLSIVLEGRQGCGKSTLARLLRPGQASDITSTLPD